MVFRSRLVTSSSRWSFCFPVITLQKRKHYFFLLFNPKRYIDRGNEYLYSYYTIYPYPNTLAY